MSDSKMLRLRSINELLDESFFIPSYQRGYRWTEAQVTDLLNDIWEFTQDVEQDKNKGFYCLQPIVVKESKSIEYKWDVIDGQQRLTTIYIILKYAKSILEDMRKKPYHIGYETRSSSGEFLEKHLNKIDESNIDFFHMSKAYESIENWFKSKDGSIKYPFINRLLLNGNIEEGIDISKNVRVIWYEVNQDEENDIEIFTRINMGKIPLTNAELIKALLLQSFSKDKQFELASQWDFIEYTLQNDGFWLFVNRAQNEKETRIEFIFELIAENYLNIDNESIKKFKGTLNKSIDSYYIFHIINDMKNNDYSNEDIWDQVNDYFRILNEWYEDREFFHKTGFLIAQGTKEHTILKFIVEYKKNDKSVFIDFLNKEIKSLFKNIEIKNLSYDDKKSHASIKKILLMFNIETIINNKDSSLRFQFDRFKNDDWDIEHIRSQTDKYPNIKKEKEDWISDLLSFDGTIIKSKDEILDMKDDEFKIFYNEMYEKLETKNDIDFDKHGIGNLALLDASTNRSYGNAFFPIKRRTILDNDMNGTFIPICTKNVFMKYYTVDVKDIRIWSKTDADDYEKKLTEVLNPYLSKEVKLGK